MYICAFFLLPYITKFLQTHHIFLEVYLLFLEYLFSISPPLMLQKKSTPEEAFSEYILHKKQDLINPANKYEDIIPDIVYKALLAREIYPF